MRKILICFVFFVISLNSVCANNEILLDNQNKIQSRIDKIGVEILNSNMLDKRVVFVYDEKDKGNLLKETDVLTKRQVVVYSGNYKKIETDDELAAYLAREIAAAVRSYNGLGNGWLSSIKIKAAPKKYELVFDKLAVDYMVKAGYNPLGLIIYVNKTFPQARQDKISSHNLTSKRLAYIYERIYSKYPDFLINNAYLDNIHYQNFLLNSLDNRILVEKKVKNPVSTRDLKYE